MADAFNTFNILRQFLPFASVFTDTNSSLPLISPSQSSSNFLDSITVSEFEFEVQPLATFVIQFVTL